MKQSRRSPDHPKQKSIALPFRRHFYQFLDDKQIDKLHDQSKKLSFDE